MNIPTVLKTITDSGSALSAITGWWKKAKGDSRAVIGELKNNMSYLEMVDEDGVELGNVIDKISVDEFKRLAKEGFNFNTLKKDKISQLALIEGSDLSSWNGKTTEELIESIYDKIIELKIRYPHLQKNAKYRWNARVINIRKRIWLLFKHIGS